MRIIAGRHRGRTLLAPEGDAVRPTSDRAREALFNILAHGDLASSGPAYADATVLDAFAGTGAFGLEALSRGATAAIFLEKSRPALAALRRNIQTLGEDARSRVIVADATAPPQAPAAATLAFLDPPYNKGLAAPALAGLAAAGWLAPDALAIVEVPAAEAIAPTAGFTLLDERRYGIAKLVFLRYAK
ncbi:MAG: putative Ribosomal small subunit methyltransferase [Rhodospirillales bacterium]|jgi:16S rRNA (guanine966-N2)-methyltransferase|nr:putative Ribosomal small subunit methyltransferase [Rhodospirillales bacterium]